MPHVIKKNRSLSESRFTPTFLALSKMRPEQKTNLSFLGSSANWPKHFVLTPTTSNFKYTPTKLPTDKNTFHQYSSSSRKKTATQYN